MEDPLSALHDRPHRYLLESDSSDEEGHGVYGDQSGSSSKPKIQTTQVYTADDIEITGRSWESYEEIVLGVGQAGRYLKRKLLGVSGQSVTEVKLRGEVVGTGFEVERRLLLNVDDGQQDSLHLIARALHRQSGSTPWLVVSTYLPSLYIPDRAFSLPSAPIRYLTIDADRIAKQKVEGAERITSPNFVTGLSAALLSLLARPSDSKTLASLVLLPLPLSSLLTSHLVQTLSSISASNSAVSPAQKGAAWTEDDDEPFSQSGMGMGKNRSRIGAKAADVKREVDGMYM